MQAWFDKYGADPTTSAAQAALTELRTEHQSDMQALLTKYGVDASLCSGGGIGCKCELPHGLNPTSRFDVRPTHRG